MFGHIRGRIRPPDYKNLTMTKLIEQLDPPPRIFLPMLMSSEPCGLLVEVGDTVNIGQPVGDSDSELSAPIHSSVSGKVIAIENLPHPQGSFCKTVVIDNDFQERLHPDIAPRGSVLSLEGSQLVSIIKAAGIVGLDGNPVPVARRLSDAAGKADMLIVSCCETQPYITADLRLAIEYAEDVIGGVRALMKILTLDKAIIAVPASNKDVFLRLSETLPQKSPITIRMVSSKYPQNDERILKRTICRNLDANRCIVFGVSVAVAIHKAITIGMPLTSRVITAVGSAISNPKNLEVRIGTPLSSVFEASGGFKELPLKIVAGGPMTGIAEYTTNIPVTKRTRSLLALTQTEVRPDIKTSACIRCGRCVRACPMELLPNYMYMFHQKGKLEQCEQYGVLNCIQCGCCSYVCPSRLHLSQSFSNAQHSLSL